MGQALLWGGVSIALLVAVWISNLPEAIGSAADMRRSGTSPRSVLLLWAGVAAVCSLAGLATVVGFALAAGLSKLT